MENELSTIDAPDLPRWAVALSLLPPGKLEIVLQMLGGDYAGLAEKISGGYVK